MKERLFTKDFTLVVIGQIISLFGNAAVRFALPLYLYPVDPVVAGGWDDRRPGEQEKYYGGA